MNCSCWRPVVQHLITSSARTKIARGRRPKSCGTSKRKRGGREVGGGCGTGGWNYRTFLFKKKTQTRIALTVSWKHESRSNSLCSSFIFADGQVQYYAAARHRTMNCTKHAQFPTILNHAVLLSHFLSVRSNAFDPCIDAFFRDALVDQAI